MKTISRKSNIPYRWQTHVLDKITRFNVIVAPRQHGKTELCAEIMNAVAHMPVDMTKRSIKINLCSDTAKRCFRVYSAALNKIFKQYKKKGKKSFWTSEKETELDFYREDGMEVNISILGSIANPTGPKGTASDLNIIDEAGKVSLSFIEEGCFPSTTKTEGINIITGTVEPNHYLDLFRRSQKKVAEGSKFWSSFYMKWEDEWAHDCLSDRQKQAVLDAHDFNDPKSKLKFEKEYGCNWLAGLEGAPYAIEYHRAYNSGRIKQVPIDRNYALSTSWDDGKGTTAIWFWQFIEGAFRFVDFREWHEGNLPDICDDVLAYYRANKCSMGHHILPHTTKERSFGQRGGLARWAQIRNAFSFRGRYKIIPKVSSIETKLSAGKQFMRVCLFDEMKCWNGINHLQMYSREMNKVTGTYKAAIKSDEHSHAGDAFGEVAMCWKLGLFGEELVHKIRPTDLGPNNINVRRFTFPY